MNKSTGCRHRQRWQRCERRYIRSQCRWWEHIDRELVFAPVKAWQSYRSRRQRYQHRNQSGHQNVDRVPVVVLVTGGDSATVFVILADSVFSHIGWQRQRRRHRNGFEHIHRVLPAVAVREARKTARVIALTVDQYTLQVNILYHFIQPSLETRTHTN